MSPLKPVEPNYHVLYPRQLTEAEIRDLLRPSLLRRFSKKALVAGALAAGTVLTSSAVQAQADPRAPTGGEEARYRGNEKARRRHRRGKDAHAGHRRRQVPEHGRRSPHAHGLLIQRDRGDGIRLARARRPDHERERARCGPRQHILLRLAENRSGVRLFWSVTDDGNRRTRRRRGGV